MLPSPELRAAQLWVAELLLKQARLQGDSGCRSDAAASGAAWSGAGTQQAAEPSRTQLDSSPSLHTLCALNASVESLGDRFRESRVALDSALDQLVKLMLSDPRFARMIAEARLSGTLQV